MEARVSIKLSAVLAFLAATAPASAAENPVLDLRSTCPSVYQPVCAGNGSETRSFGNACLAEREGFAVTAQGTCGGSGGLPRFCTKEYQPVCGEKNGERRMFGNACEARAEDFAVVHDGSC
jgi:Kazal-type serine protease inhibitor domain